MKHLIAVIEDDAPIRNLYTAKLELEGFAVVSAEDGQAGLELLEQHKPDLILLDLRMPVMNGDEMLVKLRETEWGASMRVIVLTNISRAEAPSSLRVLSVDRYLVKAHHTPQQIVEVVREVLHVRR